MTEPNIAVTFSKNNPRRLPINKWVRSEGAPVVLVVVVAAAVAAALADEEEDDDTAGVTAAVAVAGPRINDEVVLTNDKSGTDNIECPCCCWCVIPALVVAMVATFTDEEVAVAEEELVSCEVIDP